MTDQFHPGKCLPDCMMPDGGECCPGYVALYDAYWHLVRASAQPAQRETGDGTRTLAEAEDQIERLNSRIVELLRERDDLLRANQVLHNLLTNREAEIAALRGVAQQPLVAEATVRDILDEIRIDRKIGAEHRFSDEWWVVIEKCLNAALCAVTSTDNSGAK